MESSGTTQSLSTLAAVLLGMLVALLSASVLFLRKHFRSVRARAEAAAGRLQADTHVNTAGQLTQQADAAQAEADKAHESVIELVKKDTSIQNAPDAPIDDVVADLNRRFSSASGAVVGSAKSKPSK